MSRNILGLDIGSVSIGIAELDPGCGIVRTSYRLHKGRIRESLIEMLSGYDLNAISSLAVTSSTPGYVSAMKRFDNQVAVMSAARHLHGQTGAILNVGAEKFSLVLFDEKGAYTAVRTNTSCAAGTGSFLDQQALRLNLQSAERLGLLALQNRGTIPKIASRCAVFAKTDLIHAQQEGCRLEEICDGLCFGLARNIFDTLFTGIEISGKIVFCGGVSRNPAVVKHIGSLITGEMVVDDCSSVYGALGAAYLAAGEGQGRELSVSRPEDIIQVCPDSRVYAFGGLELKLSAYPDFSKSGRFEHRVSSREAPGTVEVDLYAMPPEGGRIRAYLGVDIGSTSTKAVLMDEEKNVVAGFYTRTSGRPVDAMCALFEAIDDLMARKGLILTIIGAGTTGSGRKLMGKIMGADLIVDEISAHARAAIELRADVDTIIEIGGQDSKFTTVRDGYVNFSVMNTVCAAGTGSFIEEQAQKMGCTVEEYSDRTMGISSPLSSERCTVFMERDMNYHLSEGFSRSEVLASALHSVCENYLAKVAVESMIGRTILFQGATAKNRALVAAFEHRLKRPVIVSEYCHVTGALGVALMLAEEGAEKTSFRGLGLYRKDIPVRSETCGLCSNHCKLSIADVDGCTLAYGFLCGRDYDDGKYVDNNTSGFDLLKAREKAAVSPRAWYFSQGITIGIPTALHLYDDMGFWQYFFAQLSIHTVSSTPNRHALNEGRHMSGAEFCAPVLALYGHVRYLMDKCDFVFVPFYLEDRQRSRQVRRQYCYYTQFAPSLVSGQKGDDEGRILMPLINYLYNDVSAKYRLYKMLAGILPGGISFREVSQAFDKALAHREIARRALEEMCSREMEKTDGIRVVLLGRPYTAICPSMNKGIINIFSSKGIKVFFQDMIRPGDDEPGFLKQIINDLPWKYAANILKVAETVAQKDGAYPVLVTSFRCTPDSLVVEYFKKLMNSHNKPYLILQLDEHDSNVGYETRIEAAVRAFTNHFRNGKTRPHHTFTPMIPMNILSGRTILMPNWDRFSCGLLAATLRREGLDAMLLEETEAGMHKGMRHNSGQCIPINIIAQEAIDYILKYDLDPAKCALWIGRGEVACNLKVIPHHVMNIMNDYGSGMEKISLYIGDISFLDISWRATVNAYFSFMFGGMLRRIGCRMRPYEYEKGSVDRGIEYCLDLFIDAFANSIPKEDILAAAVEHLGRIPLLKRTRPLVAVFGDLYMRDNDMANQGLVRYLESCGAEVITTPYSTYARMIAWPYFRKWLKEGKYLFTLSMYTMFSALTALEKRYYRHFQKLLGEPEHEFTDTVEEILAPYKLLPEHTGESMDNILKLHYIKKYYPDVALFVQASPAFCCPALVTEAMKMRIEEVTGVPVVTITYDGTYGDKNSAVIPYLTFPRKMHGRGGIRGS